MKEVVVKDPGQVGLYKVQEQRIGQQVFVYHGRSEVFCRRIGGNEETQQGAQSDHYQVRRIDPSDPFYKIFLAGGAALIAFHDKVPADDKKGIDGPVHIEDPVQKGKLFLPAELKCMKEKDAKRKIDPYQVEIIVLLLCHTSG